MLHDIFSARSRKKGVTKVIGRGRWNTKMSTILFLLLSLWIPAQIATRPGETLSVSLDELLNSLLMDSTPSPQDDGPPTSPQPRPFFEHINATDDVSIQLGDPVVFHCRVNNLTDMTTVSWLRRSGSRLTLVSVGLEVYASDGRFSVELVRPNDWQLQLTAASRHDEGLYECQVSSHPPLVHTVRLTVIAVPELEILDERGLPIRTKFYNAGSTIELKCVTTQAPQPNQLLIWRHGSKTLNYDTNRGGISVKTDVEEAGTKSRLFIANALPSDSGNYTCSLTDVAVTSVLVHVLNGETPAAMQHGENSASNICSTLGVILVIAFSMHTSNPI
ncbi:cell adhesion molecule 3 isoform X3 [Nilaparvata lugens]|uniref:cell adhesion molecule 3 isoform X3 n=1 Tax=Nilaparvata lugens TaxID=108931 RepID=UPI00193D7E87|nr:cell adhesion molecule 3 isoform X3 [Nilaparvata lugens]